MRLTPCGPLDTLQTIQIDSVSPKNAKTWKSRNEDIFLLFGCNTSTCKSTQTNKQTNNFAFSMFKELKGLSVHITSRRPCVYSRPVRQIVHVYYRPSSLSSKQNPNSPKEWGRIARYWFSSYPIIKTFLFRYFTLRPSVPYPGVKNIRFSWRDPSDKEMFLITKVTSSNFPIMWLCRKVVTANNKTFTFWCWNFPKKFVKLSAKFLLPNRCEEVFKGNYQRN